MKPLPIATIAPMTTVESPNTPRHFIQQIIDADVASGKWGAPGDASVVRTRFPPEPNGYLHIGHAKSICLNYGLAERHGGRFFLRFDDTNPAKEEMEYVEAIKRDVRWLGADWDGPHGAGIRFASDYFDQLYGWARELVEKGLAYVCELSGEEVRAMRGTPTEPGTPSPYRDRPAAESLDLLERMKAGAFPDGSKTLRAKIDMASPNFNLRDPVMYRVLHAHHHNTGDTWCIYPMYDWAHGLEDSIEGITHSLCTLEFENHRPLYDWFIEAINTERGPGSRWGAPIRHPQQIEFAKLRLTYTLMGKRRLIELVRDGHVAGWDDPRMSTISGFRRRGYTPEAIRTFCDDVGVTKFDSTIDVGRLEESLRADLNRRAPRRMAVLRPLKLIIENWGDGGGAERTEQMEAVNNPEDAGAGTRTVPFTRELYIERDDFMVDAPRKFFRLAPGREVRLRYGYWVTCTGYETDPATGEVVLVRCTYDPQTKGGDSPPPDAEGKVRKVKGTLHWVSAEHSVRAEVRLFDRLWMVEEPDRKPKDAPEHWHFTDSLNPDSLEVIANAMVEPALAEDAKSAAANWPDGIARFQFERLGYFCVDADTSINAGATPPPSGRGQGGGALLVFNRTTTLKDTWAKVAKKG